MRFPEAVLLAVALMPAPSSPALATPAAVPVIPAPTSVEARVCVLIDPGPFSPDEEPSAGNLSPMSLGQPLPGHSLPGAEAPLRIVVGPDGKEHASGVNMRGVSPIPVHLSESPSPESAGSHRGHVDLRNRFPPVRDQGAVGSCVGFGFAALADYLTGSRKAAWSPLALWSLGREHEGTFPANVGIAMQDAADIMDLQGSFPEVILPYPEGIQRRDPKFGFTLGRAASAAQYRSYGRRTASPVVALPSADRIVPTLDAGLPVVIAIFEPRQFDYPAPGGFVDTDGPNVPTENAHCVVVVGYDDASERLIVRNSWGRAWGDQGYCYMSYDFIEQGYIFQAFTLESHS
jgi:hypothetical protein